VPSELERWAAQRAPDLIARAEAEAVKVLRDALVAASLGGAEVSRADAPRQRRSPQSASNAPPPGASDLLWAHCVLREGTAVPPGTVGIIGGRVEHIAANDLVALVSRVPAAEFEAEPLTRNLNNLDWLERVARAHEAVLDAVLVQSTIVPLRMCTLFESEGGVRAMLERRRESLNEALGVLDGRLEWSVKVLVDRDRLMDAVQPQSEDASDAEASRLGDGGAYLRRRRDERGAREAASRVAADTAQQVHARLQDWAIDARTRPPQNRELSGHEGEMVLNAAYLIERERAEALREIVAELQEHHRGLGVRIELSGPWPPYNFVPDADARALV
jgi:hypothetical protein